MPLTDYCIWNTLGTELQLIHFNGGNYWCWYIHFHSVLLRFILVFCLDNYATFYSGYHQHAPSNGFFLCGWNLSFRGRQSTVSMVFSRALTEKVPSSLNEGRRLTRIFLVTTAFLILFIWLRWRITLLKQRGLCELSEIADILSIVNVMVFRLSLFTSCIYLIVWKHGSRGRITKDPRNFKQTEDITPTRGKGFLFFYFYFYFFYSRHLLL